VAAWLILTAAGAMPIGGVVGPASADPSGVLAVSALAASIGAAAALKAILIGAQRVGRAAWLDAAGRGLVLAVLLGVVVLVAASDPATLVATSAIAAAAALLIYLPSVFRLPTGPPSFGIRTLIGFAGPSYVANVLQFLNYRLDLFLVAYFRDLREVGLYALAAMLAQLIWLGSTATAAVVFSRTATVDEDPHAAASRTALLSRSVVLVGAAAGSVLALISPALIEVVFGAEFVDAARAIALLMPGVVLFGATNVMAGHLAGEGRPALNAGVSAASLVVTVALDLLLIPEFGMAGAAVASSAAYVSATVVMAWLFRRSTGIGMRMTLVPRVPDLERIRREVRAR
jgi:O-antigen/teichoic acid export membrane protein